MSNKSSEATTLSRHDLRMLQKLCNREMVNHVGYSEWERIAEKLDALIAARQQAEDAPEPTTLSDIIQQFEDGDLVYVCDIIHILRAMTAARQQAEGAQYERETNEANYEDWSE